MRIVGFLLVGLILGACTSDADTIETSKEEVNVESTNDLREFYYPAITEEPTIFVYADTANPLGEQIERVYLLNEDNTKQLVIEKFNSTLRIKEAYSLKVDDSLRFYDHMIVDRSAKKRKAKVEADRYFPLSKTDNTKFVTHFPGAVDSTVMISNTRSHYAEGPFKMEILGEQLDVILVKDSITWAQINPATNMGNSIDGVMNRYYAKDVGLVAYGPEDGSVIYKLSKILNEDQWQVIVNP